MIESEILLFFISRQMLGKWIKQWESTNYNNCSKNHHIFYFSFPPPQWVSITLDKKRWLLFLFYFLFIRNMGIATWRYFLFDICSIHWAKSSITFHTLIATSDHWFWPFSFFWFVLLLHFFFLASAVTQVYSWGIANGSWILSILLLEAEVDELERW